MLCMERIFVRIISTGFVENLFHPGNNDPFGPLWKDNHVENRSCPVLKGEWCHPLSPLFSFDGVRENASARRKIFWKFGGIQLTIRARCANIYLASNRGFPTYGEMSERFKELVLKTSDPKGPWVRIPLSPPFLFLIRTWRSTQVAEGAPLLRE